MKMRKILAVIATLALMLTYTITLVSCKETIAVETVTINGESTININQEVAYTATVLPKNATNKTVEWSIVSGSTAMATINPSSGLLKATTVGTVVIKAEADGKSDTKTITVNSVAQLSAPTGLQISADNLLAWDEIESASGYKVNIDGTEYDAAAASYDLSGINTAGLYAVKVRALSDDLIYLNSVFSDEIVHIVGTAGLGYAPIKNGTEWSVSRGEVTIGDVYIPAFYNSLPVTDIADYAFYVHYSMEPFLESMALPSSIKTIGISAFAYCGLKSIVIPENVEIIRQEAFRGCAKLENIIIPASVKSIHNSVFFDCRGVKSIIFEENSSLETIYFWAFYNCENLEAMVIPASVTYIGEAVFSGCTTLKNIIFEEGILLETFGRGLFSSCIGLESVIIPASVEIIDDYAFQNCSKLNAVYYGGANVVSWNDINISNVNNTSLTGATRYYYSEAQQAGNYWRYVNGVPTIWS